MVDFIKLLELSKRMGLTIFRLGSNFIPFASHPNFRREWITKVGEVLRERSSLIRSYGIRITMHPGQFVVLSSKRVEVVEKSLRELKYHFWVLDTLGVGEEGVVVVHVGSVYGGKKESIKRFIKTVRENDWLTRRLAVENDERHYNVSDVLLIGGELGIPVVFDWYHHVLNPSDFSIDRLVETWGKIVPEFHISSTPDRKHRYGEHGDYLKTEDFLTLADLWGDRGPLDVIVEAKMKERAIERLLSELGKLGVELRRPPCYSERRCV